MNSIVGNISEGVGVPNSSGSFGLPLTENTVDGISSSVSSLLDDDSREIMRTKQIEFSRLVDELEIEVEVIRTQNTYTFWDYPTRIQMNDKSYKNILLNIFEKYPNLKIIYNKILVIANEYNLGVLIANKLIQDYLEDIYYEAFEQEQNSLENRYFTFHDGNFKELFTSDILLNHYLKSKYISIADNSLCNLNINILKFLINGPKFTKGMSFIKIDFNNFSFEQLNIIFGNLTYVRYIDFVGINFVDIDADKIAFIFSKLNRLHFINLNESKFEGISNENIVKIFTSLKGLKQLYLYKMPFNQEQQELISSVLIGTKITF